MMNAGNILARKGLLFLLLFFTIGVHAQQVKLQVTATTAQKDTLPGVTLQLYSLPDTLLLQSLVGRQFPVVFSVAPHARYLIKLSAIGFENLEKQVKVADQPIHISLVLQRKNTALKAVTVVGERRLVSQEDDKTIINAEMLANTSTNAYELLEKTPGAIVDQDGNIYLNSTTPASVYINGREMKMSAADVSSFLKSLPAGSISKIEIIRTPSAMYDAAASGGIVNVVLKKGISVGTTGNINLRYDQGVYGAASAGISLTKGMGQVRTYLTYQYMHRNYYEDINSDRRLQDDTMLRQNSTTRYFSGNHYVGAGLDLAWNKKLSLTYDLRFTGTRDNNQAVSLNEISKRGDQHPFMDSRTSIDNKGSSTLLSNTVAMRYKIDSLNSVWANEIEYTRLNSSGTQSYSTYYDLPASAPVSGYGNLSHRSQAISFKSDLSLSIFYRLTLEAGLKLSRATDKNETIYFSQQGSSPVQSDTFQTTAYRYTGNISSAYTQLTKKVHGFILKAGLRFENTAITGNQSIPRPASFGIQRNDLFPYLYIRRNLFTIFGYPLTGNAIYRKSITRPDFDVLNPAPRFIDQYTYETGNSALKPQLTANYEVNATYDDFPVFAIGVNDAKDAFSRVTYKNEQTGIVYRTWDNIGSYRELYARLFGGLPPGRKYFMYVGIQCNYVQYLGAYQQTPLQYKRTSWSFFTGHSLKASSTMSLNLNGWMYVNGFRLFNELKTMGQLNLSITKNAFHKKVNIILSANDILKTNKSLFSINQGPVQVTGARIQDSRRVGITVKYNFGTVRTEEKKPAFVVPEATDGTSH